MIYMLSSIGTAKCCISNIFLKGLSLFDNIIVGHETAATRSDADEAVAAAPQGGSTNSSRISDLVHPVSLAVAAASIVLFVNVPKFVEPKLYMLYVAHLVFLCVDRCTSTGLSVYSIITSSTSYRLAWCQKRLMIIAILAVLTAVILRSFLVLPVTTIACIGLIISLAIGKVILIYLWLGSRNIDNNDAYSTEAAASHALSISCSEV